MEGEDVKLLHNELEGLGYSIPPDEKEKKYFGPATRNAVIEFQNKHNLNRTGIVDEANKNALGSGIAGEDRQMRDTSFSNTGFLQEASPCGCTNGDLAA